VNGPIAQLAALSCHANAFLAGRDIPPFLLTNSTCQFCDAVEFFVELRDQQDEPVPELAAADPDEWIHALPLREVDGVRLSFTPRNDPNISDRLSAGFAGGGQIATLEVVRDDGQTEAWSADWSVWDQDAPDRKIWRVSYRLRSIGPSRAWVGRNLRIVKAALRDSLGEIRRFSEEHTQGGFTDNFTEALTALDNPFADIGYLRDIAMPGQLGPDAESLVKASMRAWVFGGMGSWNDMSFDEPLQTEYENISDRLFAILHEAISTAVASTYLSS